MNNSCFEGTLSYLLIQTIKAHRDFAEALLAEVGLYPGQELVLLHLQEHDGATQSELVEYFCVQPATMTKKLQRMEQTDLIERRPDAVDARVSRVYLKESGEQRIGDIYRVWGEIEARTIAGLSLEERLLLRRLLMQIQHNLTSNSE